MEYVEKRIWCNIFRSLGKKLTVRVVDIYHTIPVPDYAGEYLSCVKRALEFYDGDDVMIDASSLDRIACIGHAIQEVQLGRGGDSSEE